MQGGVLPRIILESFGLAQTGEGLFSLSAVVEHEKDASRNLSPDFRILLKITIVKRINSEMHD